MAKSKKKSNNKGQNIHEHPIYKAFGMFYPSPFVAPFKKEDVMFPDAGAYYLIAACTDKKYREKLLGSLNSLVFQSYWTTKKGLEKLEAQLSSNWEDDDFKTERFKKAMKLKFVHNKQLAKLLKSWNPKEEPLYDPYAAKAQVDLIECLKEIREELK